MNKITPTSLAFEWKRYLKAKHGIELTMSVMQLGRLKHFIATTGAEAPEAMRFALDHWHDFTLHVLKSAYVPRVPDAPDIMFMCQNSNVLLVAMTLKDSPSIEVPQASASHSVQKNAPKEVVDLATVDDVLTTLAKLAEAVANNTSD